MNDQLTIVLLLGVLTLSMYRPLWREFLRYRTARRYRRWQRRNKR